MVKSKPLVTRPTVSVVIPCYNYGHYLPLAVRSALDQTGVDVDVLIVDDASTDDSAEVAHGLTAEDSRVAVMVHEVNAGHIATYNDGLKLVEGNYIVLLSADDALPRNAITRAVTLMERCPNVGLVYGFPTGFVDHPYEVTEKVRNWSVWDGQQWFSRQARTGRNVIMSPEAVMRREAWEEIGEYDPRLPHAADMFVWLSTATRWDIGRVNGPPQAFYRTHGQNMHLTTHIGMITDLRERALVFDLVFGEGRSRIKNAPSLHDQARKALARSALLLALGEGLDSDPDADPGEFTRFAISTWPDVTGSALWRRCQESAGKKTKPNRVREFVRHVNEHVAWRRWRRYGK